VQPTATGTTANPKRKPKWTMLFKFLSGQRKKLLPSKTLIAVNTDLVNTTFAKPTVIWFGHSSFLIKAGTANILVDPSFSGFAGPFKGAIKASLAAMFMMNVICLLLMHLLYRMIIMITWIILL
jgi:hypothetical protein